MPIISSLEAEAEGSPLVQDQPWLKTETLLRDRKVGVCGEKKEEEEGERKHKTEGKKTPDLSSSTVQMQLQ